MASNLTDQVRNIAQVTTAVANGDLSQKITVDAKGEILELKNTINTMVDQLSSFADEVTRVAREVGTEGKLGGQAQVRGVSGTWKDLTDNVNFMASNLTTQVRNTAQVITAVATGDLTRKITVEAKGEVATLAETINTMVDTLRSFAAEVTRVAREVGTEGQLGGQADVQGVFGTWKDLTDNVNYMAGNLTSQVRSIAQVTTAVANGDLTRKITVDARGEILELKDTINTMVDQLSAFAAEVTRVAREVGTEGKLGGQAEVEGVSGTWKRLTENVNQLAATLTTQLRAIAEVSTAVTQGDLTRSITVEAEGEVAELKDNINQMIANLRDTTQRNAEQDWLKTNLAKISGMMQGQRDLLTVARMIMSELTPTVSAHHGAFFMTEQDNGATELRLIASYGYKARKSVANKFKPGEGLVGQAALEKKTILLTQAPSDYIKVSSGLGEAAPVNVIVVPILFEDQVLAVIELAALKPFSDVDQSFLDQLVETIGVVLNTIIANMRTEELLNQSQRLTGELQSQSEELQTQQEELQQRNEELEEKAALLAEQNRDIEVKNHEIELARQSLEDKAEQLALSSKYKSEFLANMSHELRTPLNSLLILAKLLSDNPDANLSEKQVEFARTIYGSGNDLLALINDILDLSKVEAGRMDVHPTVVEMEHIQGQVQRSFGPMAEDKGLQFTTSAGKGVPPALTTDEQRLQQILKNLVSNAIKFTEKGTVELSIELPEPGTRFDAASLNRADQVVAFVVRDTGIGIAPEKMKIIFEAFQQADGTTSRKYGGTGLGLNISREIARLLGGEIRGASEVGKGSTFTLYLPDTYRPLEPVVLHSEVTPEPEPVAPRDTVLTDVDSDAGAVPSIDLLLSPGVDDDRATVESGDRVLLTVAPEPEVALAALAAARERGFKVLVTGTGDRALALARQLRPDAIVLDTQLPDDDGLAVLTRLKRQPETRHIPVHVVSSEDHRQRALNTGALAFLDKPLAPEALGEAMASLATFLDRGVKQVLVVEDDDTERSAIAELIGTGDDVEVTGVGSSEEALALLEQRAFDCMVLDLKLPGATGFDLLEKVKTDAQFSPLPVIVYTGKALTRREETRLRKYAETVIVKDVRSPERLLDETALFLHRVESRLPADKRRMIEQLHTADAIFQGKKVLIVDDDVRNVFALASALETRGMDVIYAENGADGVAMLKERPDTDLVLMDIMMPGMDGYETTKAIRKIPKFKQLPIIALTAKAMKGDREKSIAAGASDYITKPVDIEQVLSLMRVWLYR
jgi:signal transduction histidine kinase/CheY-like chemotaxis protein/HAMP domain-containing protein